jgi:hypothetical protein
LKWLQEALAAAAAAGSVQPTPPDPGRPVAPKRVRRLAGARIIEALSAPGLLLLQGKLEVTKIAALPAASDRGGHLVQVDAEPGPGVGGHTHVALR